MVLLTLVTIRHFSGPLYRNLHWYTTMGNQENNHSNTKNELIRYHTFCHCWFVFVQPPMELSVLHNSSHSLFAWTLPSTLLNLPRAKSLWSSKKLRSVSICSGVAEPVCGAISNWKEESNKWSFLYFLCEIRNNFKDFHLQTCDPKHCQQPYGLKLSYGMCSAIAKFVKKHLDSWLTNKTLEIQTLQNFSSPTK